MVGRKLAASLVRSGEAAGRAIAHQLRGGDDILKPGLMQAHLFGPHKGGHFGIAHDLHGAGRQAIIDGIKDDQRVGFFHEGQQI